MEENPQSHAQEAGLVLTRIHGALLHRAELQAVLRRAGFRARWTAKKTANQSGKMRSKQTPPISQEKRKTMNRRNFMIGSGAGLATFWPGLKMLAAPATVADSTEDYVGNQAGKAPERSTPASPTYKVLGVPLRTGSLYPGNENDAQAYRDVQLVARLQAAGCKALDDGDVKIPSYLPHHSIPPIRSWPGPRIAWECVSKRVEPYLKQPGQIPLLIGCDCSVVVGTTQALMAVSGEDVHVLYIDGDFDDAAPIPSAAKVRHPWPCGC